MPDSSQQSHKIGPEHDSLTNEDVPVTAVAPESQEDYDENSLDSQQDAVPRLNTSKIDLAKEGEHRVSKSLKVTPHDTPHQSQRRSRVKAPQNTQQSIKENPKVVQNNNQ